MSAIARNCLPTSHRSSMRAKMMKWHYRVRQFWQGFHATVTVDDLQRVTQFLPPAALTLFQELPPDAQRHSLNVLQTLQTQGEISSDLAAAALLHDVGKLAADQAGLRLNLWWRGPLVLLELLAPQLLERLALPNPSYGWRYLLYVHLEHPRIGAEWAAQQGCSEQTCWLIAQHQNQATAAGQSVAATQLALLQWADGKN